MNIIDITNKIPKSNYSTDRNGYTPSSFVLHITADSNLDNVLNWFKNPNAMVSSHYVIAKNGDVYMCVNPYFRAFHCGRVNFPTAQIYFDFHKTNPNNYTIGIECISNGEILTKNQEESLIKILKKDSKKFNIDINRYNTIGHYELDSVDRKFDPIASYSVDYVVMKLQGVDIVLGVGDRGVDVQEVQEQMIKIGYNITVDGIFGGNTEFSIKDFQRKNGLDVDGIVNIETKKSISDMIKRMSSESKVQYATKQEVDDLRKTMNRFEEVLKSNNLRLKNRN